jgi:hypothetical protein
MDHLHQSMDHTTRFVDDSPNRRFSRIQTMINELLATAAALDCEIETALRRSRHEPRSFAHPSHAKATEQRRDTILRTVESLRRQSMVEADEADL